MADERAQVEVTSGESETLIEASIRLSVDFYFYFSEGRILASTPPDVCVSDPQKKPPNRHHETPAL